MKKTKEERYAQRREWYYNHKEQSILLKKIRYRELKLECITAYGGKCSICGFTDIRALTIHHSFGDGIVHRKGVGANRSSYAQGVWRDLRDRNFPKNEGIQILCANCHMITHTTEVSN